VLLGVASCEGATAVDRRAARAIEDPVVPPVLPAPPSCGFRRQVSGTTENLSAVSFVDAMHGWVVGGFFGQPTILVTSDGGATWTPQSSGTPPDTDLRAVKFVDAQHGWIAASNFQPQFPNNFILVTSDGGATWLQQSSGIRGFLYSMDFVDTLHGWASGDTRPPVGTAIIVATTDGGATWVPQTSSLDFVYGISFVDPLRGWAVGSDERISVTTNGGATWTTQFSGTHFATELFAVHFVDAQTGWAVGGSGVAGESIFGTTNGGATWTAMGPPPSPLVDFFGVSAVDTQHAWAVGGIQGSQPAVAFATTDGATFTEQPLPGGTVALRGVSFVDASHGWAVGGNGLILACLPLLATEIELCAPDHGEISDALTLAATLTTAAHPETPIAGETVTFALGTASCTGVTDAAGRASCALTVPPPPGKQVAQATFAGDNIYSGSADAERVHVTHDHH
jgi:photosystem II stability/assembly factor-like uncharacterized protein